MGAQLCLYAAISYTASGIGSGVNINPFCTDGAPNATLTCRVATTRVGLASAAGQCLSQLNHEINLVSINNSGARRRTNDIIWRINYEATYCDLQRFRGAVDGDSHCEVFDGLVNGDFWVNLDTLSAEDRDRYDTIIQRIREGQIAKRQAINVLVERVRFYDSQPSPARRALVVESEQRVQNANDLFNGYLLGLHQIDQSNDLLVLDAPDLVLAPVGTSPVPPIPDVDTHPEPPPPSPLPPFPFNDH